MTDSATIEDDINRVMEELGEPIDGLPVRWALNEITRLTKAKVEEQNSTGVRELRQQLEKIQQSATTLRNLLRSSAVQQAAHNLWVNASHYLAGSDERNHAEYAAELVVEKLPTDLEALAKTCELAIERHELIGRRGDRRPFGDFQLPPKVYLAVLAAKVFNRLLDRQDEPINPKNEQFAVVLFYLWAAATGDRSTANWGHTIRALRLDNQEATEDDALHLSIRLSAELDANDIIKEMDRRFRSRQST